MTITEQQEAPAAVLADKRGEGLNSPSSKEMNMHDSTAPTSVSLDTLWTALGITAADAAKASGIPVRVIYSPEMSPALLAHIVTRVLEEHPAIAHRIPAESLSPAQWCKRRRQNRAAGIETVELDLRELHTVDDVWKAHDRTGLGVDEILRLINEVDEA